MDGGQVDIGFASKQSFKLWLRGVEVEAEALVGVDLLVEVLCVVCIEGVGVELPLEAAYPLRNGIFLRTAARGKAFGDTVLVRANGAQPD